MAKPKKGVVPPQLRAHLFKKGTAQSRAAGMRGGKKSRPKK